MRAPAGSWPTVRASHCPCPCSARTVDTRRNAHPPHPILQQCCGAAAAHIPSAPPAPASAHTTHARLRRHRRPAGASSLHHTTPWIRDRTDRQGFGVLLIGLGWLWLGWVGGLLCARSADNTLRGRSRVGAWHALRWLRRTGPRLVPSSATARRTAEPNPPLATSDAAWCVRSRGAYA